MRPGPGTQRNWVDLLFTAFGGIIDEQIDGDVAQRRLEQHRHGSRNVVQTRRVHC